MRYSTALALVLMTVGICIYALFFVDIPRIVRASGYVVSSASNWKAISPQPAVLTRLPLSERSLVKRGQVVAELSAERYSQHHSVESIQAQLAKDKLNLSSQELTSINAASLRTMDSVRSQLASLHRELGHTELEIELISSRIEDVYKQQARLNQLVKEGFISQEAVEVKNSEILRLKGELSAAERQQIGLKREIERQSTEMYMVGVRTSTQRVQILREMASAEQEFNEISSKRIQLVSPIDGYITQVSASPGQVVRTDIPVLIVTPESGGVEVVLLLPSRSIGFVRHNQRVSVRYHAYPHEHYGRHFGKVREISRIALPPQEVAQHIRLEEPVYTVHVALPENNLTYRDKVLSLSPGMLVEADVELDRLKVYQWLMEPLYRLGGRL